MLIRKIKISVNGVEIENAFDLVVAVNRVDNAGDLSEWMMRTDLPVRFESQVEFKFEGAIGPVGLTKNMNKVELAIFTGNDVLLQKFKKCTFDVQREGGLGDKLAYVATLITKKKVKSTHFENAWWAE